MMASVQLGLQGHRWHNGGQQITPMGVLRCLGGAGARAEVRVRCVVGASARRVWSSAWAANACTSDRMGVRR